MGASLTIRPSASLSVEQRDALERAVQAAPASWRFMVYADTVAGNDPHKFTLRITGPGFVAISPFGAGARPEKLLAFVQSVHDEHVAKPTPSQ